MESGVLSIADDLLTPEFRAKCEQIMPDKENVKRQLSTYGNNRYEKKPISFSIAVQKNHDTSGWVTPA